MHLDSTTSTRMISKYSRLIYAHVVLASLGSAASVADSTSVNSAALPRGPPQADGRGGVSLRDECAPVMKYGVDGYLRACRYKVDILDGASLLMQRVSLLPLLDADHAASLDRRLLNSHKFDVWSAANISFAFEPSSKRLFTAWGPRVQLRLVNSSDGLRHFENVHPDRPAYDHHCAPFCGVLRPRRAAGLDWHNYDVQSSGGLKRSAYSIGVQNGSTLPVHNYSPLLPDDRLPASARISGLEGCSECSFGASALSCADLVRTCLNNEFSCSASAAPQNDFSSLYCMGLYHMYLNPELAFCPLQPRESQIQMYGICDKIYLTLSRKLKKKFQDIGL